MRRSEWDKKREGESWRDKEGKIEIERHREREKRVDKLIISNN